MAPTLYTLVPSPPARAVRMTAHAIGLNLEHKEVNLIKGEHLSPEYLKLNPQHTVPTLVEEDGFILWDSHAIMAYLVSKYGKNDSLYPKDAKRRAVVDQRLHFDSGVAWAKALVIVKPIVYHGKKSIDQADIDGVQDIYRFVETFLDGRKWIAGDNLTIADYSFITTFGIFDIIIKIDKEKFPKLVDYLKRAETLPEYQATKESIQAFAELIKNLLG